MAFALALLSKSAVAPLPLVLLGLAWWRRGRVGLKDAWRTVPFFTLAAAAGLSSMWFQSHRAIGASMVVVRHDSLWSRLAGAGWAIWFYLGKALLPLNLSFIYPRWRIDASQAWSYVPGLLVLAGLLACWWYRRRWGKHLLFGLGYFVVMLLPILGFLNIYFMRYSLVADHWQYFAIIGPIALAAGGITAGLGRVQSPKSKVQSLLHATLSAALVLALGVLTWRQAGVYRDMETLWVRTLAVNPGAGMAHNNLATLLLERGQVSEAIAHFQKALALEPDAAEIHSNLGGALLDEGRLDEAAAQFREALQLQPGSAQAHNNLGTTLLHQRRLDEAIAHFQKAVEAQPGLAGAQHNLGSALLQAGRVGEAMAHLRQALELQPDLAAAHMDLGNALLSQGQVDEAVAHLQKAVELEPGLADAHYNFANALCQMGRVDEAITHYQKALTIQPNFAGAHNGLGNAFLRKGQVDAAVAQFQTALRLRPGFAEAHLNLANALLQKDAGGRSDSSVRARARAPTQRCRRPQQLRQRPASQGAGG